MVGVKSSEGSRSGRSRSQRSIRTKYVMGLYISSIKNNFLVLIFGNLDPFDDANLNFTGLKLIEIVTQHNLSKRSIYGFKPRRRRKEKALRKILQQEESIGDAWHLVEDEDDLELPDNEDLQRFSSRFKI